MSWSATASPVAPPRPSAGAYNERPWIVGGLLTVLLLTTGLGVLVDWANYDVWAAVVTYVVIVGITAPALWYISRVDKDPKLFGILVLALLIKLLMALARYYMINVMYGGEADAAIYHSAGVYFSDHIKDGYAAVQLGPFMTGFPDTSKHVGIVTGITYLITGPSQYAGFFVFSWFSYIGNLLLARGFKAGFPEGLHRRYLLIVMFLPSLMFWPSSIGKEGWMMLCLGMVGYGAGHVLAPKGKFLGLVPIVLGVTGAMWIRPHMALVCAFSVIVGLAYWLIGGRQTQGVVQRRFGARQPTGRSRSVVVRLVILGIVTILAIGASSQLDALFGSTEEGTSTATGAEDKLTETLERTFRGGSKFETEPVRSIRDVPGATLSVLFRPFPWEAGSINVLISSAEGVLFVLLGLTAWRSLARLPGNLWRRPYLVFCLVYSMAFVVAFSNIANAGILARQRVQMLPVVLVILALPEQRWWRKDEPEAAEAAPVLAPRGVGDDARYSESVASGVGGSPEAIEAGGVL